MNISQDFILNLKDSIDIVSHISKYTQLKRNGNIYSGKCPHPSHNDKTPSFRVWGDTQSWACMGCHYGSKGGDNYGSDVIAFEQWINNINFVDAVVKLSNEYSIEIPKTEKENPQYLKNKRFSIDSHMKVILIEEYLSSRGINRDAILKHKIGFDGNRIIIPLFDKLNRVVGFSKRSYLDDDGPKYINSKNSDIFNKSKFLYNYNNIDYNKDYLFLTEGAFDVIVADRYGLKNVVSTLGTAVTSEHIKIIKDTKLTPIICFDGDDAGVKATEKLVSRFNSNNIYHKIFPMPKDLDLADLANTIKDGLSDVIIDNSISYNQFLIDKILLRYESQVNEIKVKIYPEIKKIVDSIEHDVERKIISDKIENELQIKL